MKQRKRKAFLLVSICAFAAIVFLFFESKKIGKELDGYRGVPVYYNGLVFFRSYGRNYSADGYYYGQKWQCVEFIKRFYEQAKGHRMPDVMGHAKSFFDDNLPDGTLNQQRALVQYRNGSTNKPCADDLVVFTDTKYGHVAIVAEVGGDYLEVIQQNILGKPRQRFTLVTTNGHYFVSAPRCPAGWLRKN
jgi:surface antigen